MFDKISSGIKEFLDRFGRKGLLTKKDIEEGLESFKKILISSDVNIKVVKEILRRVKREAEKEESLKSLLPQEQMTKILYHELIKILGKSYPLKLSSIPPTEIVLFGIQGSGKTTTCGKIAHLLKDRGYKVVLVPLDLKRPGAIEQLKEISEKVGVDFFFNKKDLYKLIKEVKSFSKKRGVDFIIYDTPGRIHVDKEMMDELKDIKDEIKPKESLLVASALLGQGSVDIAMEFKRRIGITGIVATKVDGDSKGGAILSMKFVTGVPIKFVGTGEKMENISEFDPESFASRIIGLGDIKGLIKKIERMKEEEREKLTLRRRERFDMNLFLSQMKMIEKMGGFASLLSHIPGIPTDFNIEDREIKKIKAIIQSMTKEERRHPEIIDGSRKRRIARGSGTNVNDINRLLKNFKAMKNMMKDKNMSKILRKGGFI